MPGASRSRLLELRAELEAAERGREALERRRELLLIELRRAVVSRDEQQRITLGQLSAARKAVARARIELGSTAVDAAILAQPNDAAVDLRAATLVGVPIPRLTTTARSFRPAYGPASTAASLDAAGAAFTALLPSLVLLAERTAQAQALRRGLRRTARRESALDRVLIPHLRADLAATRSALEEEERDEFLRTRTLRESHPL